MSDLEDRAADHLVKRALQPPERQRKVLGYRLDFAWPFALIAIEMDGPMHHRDGAGDRDARRDRRLREQGWIVLRCSDDREVARAVHLVNLAIRFNDLGLQAAWRKNNKTRDLRATDGKPESWIPDDPGPTTGLGSRRSHRPSPTAHQRRRL